MITICLETLTDEMSRLIVGPATIRISRHNVWDISLFLKQIMIFRLKGDLLPAVQNPAS